MSASPYGDAAIPRADVLGTAVRFATASCAALTLLAPLVEAAHILGSTMKRGAEKMVWNALKSDYLPQWTATNTKVLDPARYSHKMTNIAG